MDTRGEGHPTWSPNEVAWDGISLTAHTISGEDVPIPKIEKYYIKGRGAANTASGATTLSASNCRVPGCTADLSRDLAYFRKYRICREHLKSPVLVVEGVPSRFCQQCSRFHHVREFDGPQRTCRAMLERLRIKRNSSKAQGAGRRKDTQFHSHSAPRGGTSSHSNSTGKEAENSQQDQQASGRDGQAPSRSGEGADSAAAAQGGAEEHPRLMGTSLAALSGAMALSAMPLGLLDMPPIRLSDTSRTGLHGGLGAAAVDASGSQDQAQDTIDLTRFRTAPLLMATRANALLGMPPGEGGSLGSGRGGNAGGGSCLPLAGSDLAAGSDTMALTGARSKPTLYSDAPYGRGGRSGGDTIPGAGHGTAAAQQVGLLSPTGLGKIQALLSGTPGRGSQSRDKETWDFMDGGGGGGGGGIGVGGGDNAGGVEMGVLNLGNSRVAGDPALELQLRDIYREMSITDIALPLHERPSNASLHRELKPAFLARLRQSSPAHQGALLQLRASAQQPQPQLQLQISSTSIRTQRNAELQQNPQSQQQLLQQRPLTNAQRSQPGDTSSDGLRMRLAAEHLRLLQVGQQLLSPAQQQQQQQQQQHQQLQKKCSPQSAVQPWLRARLQQHLLAQEQQLNPQGTLSLTGGQKGPHDAMEVDGMKPMGLGPAGAATGAGIDACSGHTTLLPGARQMVLQDGGGGAGASVGGGGGGGGSSGAGAFGAAGGGGAVSLADPHLRGAAHDDMHAGYGCTYSEMASVQMHDGSRPGTGAGYVGHRNSHEMALSGPQMFGEPWQDVGGRERCSLMAAMPESGDGRCGPCHPDDVDAALEMLMEEAGHGAVYHSGTPTLERVCFKLHHVHPRDLPPDLLTAMGSWLAGAPAEVVQGAIRPGCTQLILDIYVGTTVGADPVTLEGFCGEGLLVQDEDLIGGGAAAAAAAPEAASGPGGGGGDAGLPPAPSGAVGTKGAEAPTGADTGCKIRVLAGHSLTDTELADLEAAAAAAGAEALSTRPLASTHGSASGPGADGNGANSAWPQPHAQLLASFVMHGGNARLASTSFKKLLGPRAIESMAVSMGHELINISSRDEGRYVADLRGTLSGVRNPLLLAVAPLAVVAGGACNLRATGAHLVGPARRPQLRCQGTHVACTVVPPATGVWPRLKVNPGQGQGSVCTMLLEKTLPGTHRAEAEAACTAVDLRLTAPEPGLMVLEWEEDRPAGLSVSDWLPLLSVPDADMAAEINKLESRRDRAGMRLRGFLTDLGMLLDYVTRLNHHVLLPVPAIMALKAAEGREAMAEGLRRRQEHREGQDQEEGGGQEGGGEQDDDTLAAAGAGARIRAFNAVPRASGDSGGDSEGEGAEAESAAWSSRSSGGGSDQRVVPGSSDAEGRAPRPASLSIGPGGRSPDRDDRPPNLDSRYELMGFSRLSRQHFTRVRLMVPQLLAFAADSGMPAVMSFIIDFMLEHVTYGDLPAVFQCVEVVGGGPPGNPGAAGRGAPAAAAAAAAAGNAGGAGGLPLLHRAVRSGNPAAVRLLLSCAAAKGMMCNFAQMAGPFNITPLHLAALLPANNGMLQACQSAGVHVIRLWNTVVDAAGRTPAAYFRRQLERSYRLNTHDTAPATSAGPASSSSSAPGPGVAGGTASGSGPVPLRASNSGSGTAYCSWGSDEPGGIRDFTDDGVMDVNGAGGGASGAFTRAVAVSPVPSGGAAGAGPAGGHGHSGTADSAAPAAVAAAGAEVDGCPAATPHNSIVDTSDSAHDYEERRALRGAGLRLADAAGALQMQDAIGEAYGSGMHTTRSSSYDNSQVPAASTPPGAATSGGLRVPTATPGSYVVINDFDRAVGTSWPEDRANDAPTVIFSSSLVQEHDKEPGPEPGSGPGPGPDGPRRTRARAPIPRPGSGNQGVPVAGSARLRQGQQPTGVLRTEEQQRQREPAVGPEQPTAAVAQEGQGQQRQQQRQGHPPGESQPVKPLRGAAPRPDDVFAGHPGHGYVDWGRPDALSSCHLGPSVAIEMEGQGAGPGGEAGLGGDDGLTTNILAAARTAGGPRTGRWLSSALRRVGKHLGFPHSANGGVQGSGSAASITASSVLSVSSADGGFGSPRGAMTGAGGGEGSLGHDLGGVAVRD